MLRERCGGDLLGLRFLSAESHPEIQIADMLAGTVRHIAESGDPRLLELIEPYVAQVVPTGHLPWGTPPVAP